MLAQVLTSDPVAFLAWPPKQPDNQRGRSEDDALQRRRLAAIVLERTAMTRVPTLDWPSDLFAEVRVEIAA